MKREHCSRRLLMFCVIGFFVVLSQYLAIVICFVVNIIAKYLDWGGFKVVLEWNARGSLLFVFQHIYYLAEGFLISLIIVFG